MVDDKGTLKDLKTCFIHNNSDVSDSRAQLTFCMQKYLALNLHQHDLEKF